MGAAREQVIERLDPIAGDHDLVLDAGLLERPQGEQLVVGVVLDQEDDLAAHLASNPPPKGPLAQVLSTTVVYRHGMSLCSTGSVSDNASRAFRNAFSLTAEVGFLLHLLSFRPGLRVRLYTRVRSSL